MLSTFSVSARASTSSATTPDGPKIRSTSTPVSSHALTSHSWRGLDGGVDAILIAGALTTHGAPPQAGLFGEACRPLSVPVVAVLGNHDWPADRVPEVRAALEAGGVRVLEREWTVLELRGTEV